MRINPKASNRKQYYHLSISLLHVCSPASGSTSLTRPMMSSLDVFLGLMNPLALGLFLAPTESEAPPPPAAIKIGSTPALET